MDRSLRRECRVRFDELQLPDDLSDMDHLVAHVAGYRQRPILLHPMRLRPAGISGAWLPTSTTDHLFYEAETSPRHQLQIVGHELGHIVAGHGSDVRLEPLGVGADILDAASLMLHRSTYDSEQERAAERLADMFVRHLDIATAEGSGGVIGGALRPRANRSDL